MSLKVAQQSGNNMNTSHVLSEPPKSHTTTVSTPPSAEAMATDSSFGHKSAPTMASTRSTTTGTVATDHLRANNTNTNTTTTISNESMINIDASTATSFLSDDCATFDRVLFQVNCEDRCSPYVSMDEETVLFTRDYAHVRFLSATDFEEVSAFGFREEIGSIEISGNSAAVSILDSVRVYERGTFGEWGEVMRITSSDLDQEEGSDVFATVAIDERNNLLVIGVPKDESAFIFRRNKTTWVREEKLVPEDHNATSFGYSVSVRKDVVAVSNGNGFVFVYEYSPYSSQAPWTSVDHVTLTNDECDGGFGHRLELVQDQGILVACPGDNYKNGAVYYYTSRRARRRLPRGYFMGGRKVV